MPEAICVGYIPLDEFNYREENVLPRCLIDSAKTGVLGTRKYGENTDLLTLIEESLTKFWLCGKNPEIVESLKKEGYGLGTKIPVLKIITGQPPNQIWYHPRTGEKLCDDAEFRKNN